MDCFEPTNLKEWLGRVFALRPVLIFLLILGAGITEFRFDWGEKVLGAYLVRTNQERPESGAIWEIGHRKITARKTLERIITNRQAIQRGARDATSFAQVAARISPDAEGIMLSPDHFRSIYVALSPSLAQKIISSIELIRIISEGHWDRTYFEKTNDSLIIYFLDKNNRVIRQLDILPELLYAITQRDVDEVGTLDKFPIFKNRIYPVIRFFEALESLPEEVRKSIITQPDKLLELTGQVERVGISDETASGFIELGFEVVSGNQRKVLVQRAPEWAVWLLRSNLEGKQPSLLNDDSVNRVP